MTKEIIFHILMALAVGALSRYFPTPPKKIPAHFDETSVMRLYNRSIGIYIAGFLIWILCCSWVVAQILHFIAVWNSHLLSDTAISILPPGSAWLISGICFALAWYRGPVEGFLRTIMGADAVVSIYLMSPGGYDERDEILWRYLRKTFVFLGVVAIFILLDTGIYVYPERIVFNEGTSVFVQKTKRMSDIIGIRLERDTINEKAISPSPPDYVIAFEDGYVWKSNWSDFGEAQTVVLHIAHQNNLNIDTIFVDMRKKYYNSN